MPLLRGMTKAEDFVARLRRVCGITLTDDFWKVTLPNELANSSTASPSLSVYEAAQVLLDAPALFSNSRIGDLLDPAISATKSAVERHHLFPKGYLATLGILETRQTNQIANLAYLEWSDNAQVSDQAPAEYLPALEERFSEIELSTMNHRHALPQNWEQMENQEFLERRRDLMAGIIHEGYRKLTEAAVVEATMEDFDLTDLISGGESDVGGVQVHSEGQSAHRRKGLTDRRCRP